MGNGSQDVYPTAPPVPRVPGPDVRVSITEAYAKHVAKDAYVWAWPMVNIYNRRLAFTPVKRAVKAGPLIQAPVNQIAMLTDYVDPAERSVACPTFGDDGSLTIYVQADQPTDDAQRANWLPAPKGDFSLYVRAYWPKEPVSNGSWTPPAVIKVK